MLYHLILFNENYKERYQIIKHQREAAKLDEITSIEKYTLQPNSMQVGFITNLKKILCSRGKTGASYFCYRGTWYICDRWKKLRIYKGFGSLVLDVSV